MIFTYTRYNKLKGIHNKKILQGNLGLQSTGYGILTEGHVIFLKSFLSKRYKKFKLNYTFNKNLTKKSLETRMGGGKGIISKRISTVKPGDIIIEIYSNINSLNLIYVCLKELTYKLPIKLRIIKFI